MTNEIKKQIVVAPFLILGFLVLWGCLPGPLIVWTEDISSQESLWYGYKYKGIYILKEDVFISTTDLPLSNKNVLVAPREKTQGICTLLHSAPFSVEEYNLNRTHWEIIKGVATKGTRMQCNRIIKYNPLGYPSSLIFYATILDGPFSGKEADISDLSLLGPEHADGSLMKPNPRLLVSE
jgi:hypothetical protein